MKFPTELFINGAYRKSASGRVTKLTNPTTEEMFAEVAAADVSDVNVAVDWAQKAWESGFLILTATGGNWPSKARSSR